MIQAFLESLQPDRDQLLSEISKHITDDMLAEIALADYGLDQEQHLAALRRLRDTGTFVKPMHMYPCEVLELTRNSQPDDPEWRPGDTGVCGHWMRAFASAALLRAREDPWSYGADPAFPSYTLIQLIDSVDTLPVDFDPELVRLLAWMMLHSDLEGRDEQVICYAVGLLWLALNLKTPPSDQHLIELSDWIVRREAEIHDGLPSAFDRWLLGIEFDSPPSRWEDLGKRLAALDLSSHSRELADWVQLIGRELAGETIE
ncbi:MAG: hypothetical protein WCA44_16820 [Acidobacteriaceae bacterium]|jgi:hypothetical protein